MKNNKILYFIFLSVFIHGIVYFFFDNKKQKQLFLKEKINLLINIKQKIQIKRTTSNTKKNKC